MNRHPTLIRIPKASLTVAMDILRLSLMEAMQAAVDRGRLSHEAANEILADYAERTKARLPEIDATFD